MATVYHRDQAGAPALTYSSADAAQFDAFKAILKACLVSGYGVFPAAGWEFINEGPNFIVLRNGTRSGYVCFSNSGMVVTCYVSETYAGVSGTVMLGGGLKSGVAAGVSVPQKILVRELVQRSASTSWMMVADEKTFTLGMSVAASNSDLEMTETNGQGWCATGVLYCGEDSKGNFIICGGLNSTATSPSTHYMKFGDRGFTALRDPATGLLVDTGVLVPRVPLTLDRTTADVGAQLLDKVYLCPMSWISGGVVANFRGLCFEPRTILNFLSSGAQMLGSVGAVTFRSVSTPIPLGDDHTYMPAPRYSGYMAFFLLTDNPEFW